jgi:hypothetical protein
MKNLLNSQTFKCIDVIDENCGVVGRLNKRITDVQTLRGIGYVNTTNFEMGGTAHDTNYYATKDNNKLGHDYNQNQFENGNFIKHIYTTILDTNVNLVVLLLDILSEETHDVTVEICEVKHGPYTGTETTDLPTLHSETFSNVTGRIKRYSTYFSNFTEPTIVAVRLRFTGAAHGNHQVTMVSTLQATVFTP